MLKWLVMTTGILFLRHSLATVLDMGAGSCRWATSGLMCDRKLFTSEEEATVILNPLRNGLGSERNLTSV